MPNLRRNLISLGMLDSNRESYKSENGILRVMKGSMVVLKGILKQGLYVLQAETISGSIAVSSIKNDDTALWYRRLGHIRMKCLQELSKHGILDSKRINNLNLCETCVMDKSQEVVVCTCNT